ncbi:hypothetical protein E2C01_080550 [Portunus trituberculatus]|uniref:Uncharacterized protein n=1 Tax=Portunus trituberculatus TaxID=210409 RepID=A0A5B7IMI2_PORTR|nr:hypothetical protein [Portunus trituberculatus]
MLSRLKPETASVRLPLPPLAGHAPPRVTWLRGVTAGITKGLSFYFVLTRRGAGGGDVVGAILSH